jgi:hypothetical protein
MNAILLHGIVDGIQESLPGCAASATLRKEQEDQILAEWMEHAAPSAACSIHGP